MSRSSILISILCLLFQFSYSQPTNVTVETGAYYYNPDPIEIEVGSTVTWINVGGLHDVNGIISTISGESFDLYSCQAVAGAAEAPAQTPYCCAVRSARGRPHILHPFVVQSAENP